MRNKAGISVITLIFMAFILLLPGISSAVEKTPEYQIFYSRYANQEKTMGSQRTTFTMTEMLEPGIVSRNGRTNLFLPVKKFFMGLCSCVEYPCYFFISANSNPKKEIHGFTMFDFDTPDQVLYTGDTGGKNFGEIRSFTGGDYPSDVRLSPNSRYLIYLMSRFEKKQNSFLSKRYDMKAEDSSLIIRDQKTGKEIKAIVNKYNRHLFESFLHFSKKENCLYTITIDNGQYRMIKIPLNTGKEIPMATAFPGFKWENLKMKELFSPKTMGTKFALSPDETVLAFYTNYPECGCSANHKLSVALLNKNEVRICSQGNSKIGGITWKPDSSHFAYIINTKIDCYPSQLNSSIFTMNREGRDRKEIVFMKDHRINSLSWSPDGSEIAFAHYGLDYIGRISTVTPSDKKIRQVLSTETTEKDKEKNKKNPVIFTVKSWVIKGSGK